MEIRRIQGMTRNLGAPPNWNRETDGSCGGLPIRDERHGAYPAMVSAWAPTLAEMAYLERGASLYLKIIGTNVHPPVSLYVGSPEPDTLDTRAIAIQRLEDMVSLTDLGLPVVRQVREIIDILKGV